MTLSEENYLKTIFLLYDERKTEVTTTAIADLLYTKASSVTDMLKKLSDKGLINYRKYQGVTLTPKGTQKAIQIVRKHRLWEVFLVEKLNFSWDEVHEIAEELEHIQSDKLISRLDAFLGFPERDPHGDPIPNEQGVFTTTIKTLLSELNDGDKGVCIAVKNTSKEFLVYLNKVGIALENEIEIISKEPFDNSMTVLVNDQKVNLSAIVCRNIYVAGIGGRNKEKKHWKRFMKKSSVKKLGILCAVLFLLISGYFLYRYFSKLRFEEVTIERSTDDCEDDCLSVSLNYLHCKGNSEFARNFNKEIETQVANFLLSNDDDTLQVDISIEKALENFMSDYNNIHEHFPEIPAYELILSDSIMWQNSKMLTLVSNRYSFTGGANAVQSKVFTHFALDNGEVITNENLFTDEAKVTAIAEKYFKQTQEASVIEVLDDKGFGFDGNGFHLPKSMGISADYLILFYEPFEIASYMDAAFEVKVPMKEVMPYLTFKED